MSTILMEKYIKSYALKNAPDKRFIELQKEFRGLTGALTAQLISNCVNLMNKDLYYLEIGIFQGANLVSVSHTNPSKKCIGVDNFSEHFIETSEYEESEEQLVKKRLEKYNCKNTTVYKSDFREWIKNNLQNYSKKVGVYMYDGPHELQDQIDGVEMIFPMLADEAIIFVDDLACPNTIESVKVLLNNHKCLRPLMNTPNDCDKLGYQQGQILFKYRRSE